MAKSRMGSVEPTTGAPEPPVALEESGSEPSPGRLGSKPPPGLYLVATPIGNLGDISHRAVAVLKAADVIACEDTRVTSRLLARYGIKASLIPYHEHNAEQAGATLLARLKDAQVIALVSDAGTPLVSDPGWRLVHSAREQGIMVTAIPGASAVLTALQLSGLPAERFLFAGFLPNKSAARRQVARELALVPATLVFFDSPNRLADSLADLAAVLGPRECAVARELTKLHEEVVHGTLPGLAERYAAQGAPRGEVVMVIAPPKEEATPQSGDDLDRRILDAIAAGASVKDAAQLVSAETGHNRREIYARALTLTKRTGR